MWSNFWLCGFKLNYFISASRKCNFCVHLFNKQELFLSDLIKDKYFFLNYYDAVLHMPAENWNIAKLKKSQINCAAPIEFGSYV